MEKDVYYCSECEAECSIETIDVVQFCPVCGSDEIDLHQPEFLCDCGDEDCEGCS